MPTFYKPEDWRLQVADTLALIYWMDCHNKTYPAFSVCAKVGSTFFLAWHSVHKNKHHKHKSLNKALVAHCIGDLLIELPIHNAILIAIPAFFVGHLSCTHYLSAGRLKHHEMDNKRKMGLILFTVASAYITQQIASSASGVLSYAIPIYALALGYMFIVAASQKQNPWSAMMSALLYVASDIGVASIKLKIANIPYGNIFTWGSYYSAQRWCTALVNNNVEQAHLTKP